MSLGKSFENSHDYFETAMNFLKEFSWIYKTSNTNFIKFEVLDEFPNNWKKYFLEVSNENLNLFPTNEEKDLLAPKCLQKFQNILNDLRPIRYETISWQNTSIYFRKMSPKKLHEIDRLSKLIEETCHNEIDVFIDFGSGLGYLSEILYKNYNYKILGLECDESRVQTAIERQQNFYPSSKDSIFYKTQFITDDCGDKILEYLNNLFPNLANPRIAIIGLHACADLTISSMKLFLQIDLIQKLIIMPCCYHKLELIENNELLFKNFPLSNSLRSVNEKWQNIEIFNRPFLRLACQQTNSRWKDMKESEHLEHGMEMFIRGILQAILNENEFVSKVKNQKKIKIQNFNEDLFEKIKSQYVIKNSNGNELSWTEDHFRRFGNFLIKYPEGNKLAEGLTCLQTAMQDFCENLVLYDRICFMNEQAKHNEIEIFVSFKKIMDDKLSPRCFALVAEMKISN